MKLLAYFASLACAAPCVALAAWVRTVDHAISTRNVFTLFYHFLLAFGRGLPIVLLAFLVLVVAGFFPISRPAGAIVVLVLNGAALWIIMSSPAAPKTASEFLFFVPALLSVLLATLLLLDRAHSSKHSSVLRTGDAAPKPGAPA